MKIDLKKKLKHLYNPSSKEVVIVDVSEMNFLMIDGSGNPNTSQAYKDAVEALFTVSYSLKFMVKKEKKVDYAVMPLEGLWWTEHMTNFSITNKEDWKWTSVIMQPEYVTKENIKEALEEVKKKKNPPALSKIKFEPFHEGLSAQTMHIGPYSAEAPTIQKIHNFMKSKGYVPHGKHHEIYLSDPRKSTPEKMKTILRQPIKTRNE